MNKQELFERDVAHFLETKNLDKNKITIQTVPSKGRGATEMFCSICGGIIASAIWDGIKWVWTHYSHSCSPPNPPKPPEPTPTPECCPICGAQLVPGKKHFCE